MNETTPKDFLIIAKYLTKGFLSRYKSLRRDPDEVFSICVFAVAKRTKSYDPTRCPWGPYILTYAKQEAKTLLMQYGYLPDKRHGRYAEKPFINPSQVVEHIGKKRDNNQWMRQIEARDFCEKALSILPDRQRDLVEKYYIDGMTQTELGKEYGVSKQRIEQIIKQGLKIVRERLVV